MCTVPSAPDCWALPRPGPSQAGAGRPWPHRAAPEKARYVKFEAAAWAVEARPPPSAWRQYPVYDGYPRARVPLTLVANTPLRIPPSPFIKTVQVPRGFNVADERIAEHVCNRATW